MKHFLLLAALLLPLLCGCHHKKKDIENPVTYFDDYDREVTIPAAPKRIVSGSPAITEILFALHADSLLVGRTEFCTFPPQARNIASIGDLINLNVEAVAALNPDLMLCGSIVSAEKVEKLQRFNIPVLCLTEQSTIDGLFRNISILGKIVGKEETAKHLCDSLQAQLSQIFTSLPTAIPPTVYYVVGFGAGGDFTAGANTYINQMIQMAGGDNIAESAKGWSFSRESLMAANPDFIVIRQTDSAAFCQMSPYSQLSAVRNHRVIALPEGTLDLQIPRNIDAIRLLRSHFSAFCQEKYKIK